MASDNKVSSGRDAAFSSRTRELRAATPGPGLTFGELPRKTASDPRGSDPYNTSGSFDRTKNWIRVGKR